MSVRVGLCVSVKMAELMKVSVFVIKFDEFGEECNYASVRIGM